MSRKDTSWKKRIAEILSQRERATVYVENLNPSAVLIPIYEKMGEHHIILTKRTHYVEHHKGQISFPGGAYDDEDDELETTALRETFEEIGVDPNDVEVLGNIDDQAVFTSKFIITPFVGVIPYPYEFQVSQHEVDELIEVPVMALLDPSNFCPQTMDAEGNLQDWGSFYYQGHHIKGITAKMLKQFLDLAYVEVA